MKVKGLSLYQKIVLIIVVIGLLPLTILMGWMANRIISQYREALEEQYQYAAENTLERVVTQIESYNNISKMPYYYTMAAGEDTTFFYMTYDSLRQIIYGEPYSEENRNAGRERDMKVFLRNIGNLSMEIRHIAFIADVPGEGKLFFFHSSGADNWEDTDRFEDVVGYSEWDRSNSKLTIIPSHDSDYTYGDAGQMITLARNYFDLRGSVGTQRYVGTLFLDIRLDGFKRVIDKISFKGTDACFLLDADKNCIYSTNGALIGTNMESFISKDHEGDRWMRIIANDEEYGLTFMLDVDTEKAFESLRRIQIGMYSILAVSVFLLLLSSLFFSKKITQPIAEMMKNMDQIGMGNFDLQMPVTSKDEIGILTERFNEMSVTLQKYVQQSYIAKIKQNEAELTALKSQIYPHFLYNTLEIIRMTALDEGNKNVPEMIEALSEQIHYLIGPLKDLVPIEKEVDIVQKYIYLLNCRIKGKIIFTTDIKVPGPVMIPRLILQPVVENAYIHGIKGNRDVGTIMVEACSSHDGLEIAIMDNGIGMDEKTVQGLYDLMGSDVPGVKNAYNWQSIGLKNVQDRIKNLYGESYGIEIVSTVGVGTMVKLTLPLLKADGG